MDDFKGIQKFNELILKYQEDQITDDELTQFKTFLRTNANAREIYIETCIMRSVFQGRKSPDLEIDTSFIMRDDVEHESLEALAEYEKNADSIKVAPVNFPHGKSVLKIEERHLDKTVRRNSLLILIISTAALILFFLYVRFIPPRQYGFQVAVLSDSMNAKWADMDSSMEKGTSLLTSVENLLLRQGYIELLFNTNARVTIEGPAEFQILAEDAIKLNYGKIYAAVPQEAIGFTINTPSAKVIDLGTAFGVQADLNGDTMLHVIEGKTTLVAGDKTNKASLEVDRGTAKKVSTVRQNISDITCDDRLFVRKIDSDRQILWRGQMEVNLADIVGGGNGYGGGTLHEGILVETGKVIDDLMTTDVKAGSADYKTVENSEYIDGVFVPGLSNGPTQITADGSIQVGFPKTTGSYWGYIFNGAYHEGGGVPRHSLQLNGIIYGGPEQSAITMHSNQGITFDLSEIRKNVPKGKITAFRSLIGISETVRTHFVRQNASENTSSAEMETLLNATHSSVDFWVFLDGKKMYKGTLSDMDNPVQLDIPITERDTFLTLTVTESDHSWAYDWALFGRPELIIMKSD